MAYGNERDYRVRIARKVDGMTHWPIIETVTHEIDGERVGTLSEAFFDAAMMWAGAFADSRALKNGEITKEDESLMNLYESVHNTGHGSMHLKWTALDPENLLVFKMEIDYTIDVVD